MNAGKRDGRETADILRIHSVRFKYLVTLFVVIFLACGITYLVTFINIWGRMQQSAELQIQSVVDIFAGFMDRSGLTTRDIVDELRKRLDVVEVYERADELPGPLSGAALEPGKPRCARWRAVLKGRCGCRTATCTFRSRPRRASSRGSGSWCYRPSSSARRSRASARWSPSTAPSARCKSSTRPSGRWRAATSTCTSTLRAATKWGSWCATSTGWSGSCATSNISARTLCSSVSHEFKTPIAAIQGSVKLLTSAPYGKLSEEKFQKYTRLISDETDRMASLSSNLLRLSRLENQSTAENPTVFSLDEQIRRCILLLENQWHARHIDLDIQLDRADYRGTRSSCSSSG